MNKTVQIALNESKLKPVNPEVLLQRLNLSSGKAAELCQISRRQLTYWTEKGIISTITDNNAPLEEERYSYDYTAIKRILRIKQHLRPGCGLMRAARIANESYQPATAKPVEIMLKQSLILNDIAELLRDLLTQHLLSTRELRVLVKELALYLDLLSVIKQENIETQPQSLSKIVDQLAKQVKKSLHMVAAD